MSSKWADTLPAGLKGSLGRGLGLRVAVWYAAVFVTSVIVLVALIYWLLSSSLKQRDHEIIQSTLRAYAAQYEAGGLPALARAVELEVNSGRHERLFVRVLGPRQNALFYTLPPEWNQFDVDALAPGAGGGSAGSGSGRQQQRRRHGFVGGGARPRSQRRRAPGSGVAAAVGRDDHPGRQEHRGPRRTARLLSRGDRLRDARGDADRRRRRHRADALDAAPRPSPDRRRPRHHPDRTHGHARAGARRAERPRPASASRRDRRVEHAVQRDARSHHHADCRDARFARQRRARSADADDAAARHGGARAGIRQSGGAARGAGVVPRGVGSHPVDAEHADGHLRGRNRHAAAADRGGVAARAGRGSRRSL